ncbi:MAG: hemerythrin family protein [Magnetococcales bacterium]|nr:hemerythrin family protein [Magnetococcales bacterium]
MSLSNQDQNSSCLLKDVGIMRFNKEHMRLASYVAEFQEVVDSLRTREANIEDWRHIDALFGRILKVASGHFKAEEDMMNAQGYPGYDSQKKQHDKFLEKMLKVQEDIRGRKIKFKDDFKAMLWDWLINHINQVDVEYRDFFNKK